MVITFHLLCLPHLRGKGGVYSLIGPSSDSVVYTHFVVTAIVTVLATSEGKGE